MRSTYSITMEAIQAVFEDDRLREKFTNPRMDKAICEERERGDLWREIAKRHRKSEQYCRDVMRRADVLYRIWLA